MNPSLENDTLLKALLREPVDYTPVWIMRQAGRYLPEYREVRSQAGDFMSLCKNPDLACEVTLQPLRRFPLDAAILFSDILTIPDAMGCGLYFAEGEGPRFERPVRTAADIKALAVPDIADELGYVTDAVSVIRRELKGRVPLIGFSGSPWTLATYMVEGGSSRTFGRVKALLVEQPETARQLLQVLADSVVAYLNAQIAAGAQAVMVFDTWGGALSPRLYREFSLHYMQYIVDQLDREAEGRRVPVVLFTKNAGPRLADLARSGADALGVDWTTDLAEARRYTEDRVALQGNLDPALLAASPDAIRQEAERVLESYGDGPGHVFNLGHGITPDINPDHLAVLVEHVHESSRRRANAG
ncbi:MAG: uroporphyrinogen decarboxylase [Pseudomonadota bacterium]